MRNFKPQYPTSTLCNSWIHKTVHMWRTGGDDIIKIVFLLQAAKKLRKLRCFVVSFEQLNIWSKSPWLVVNSEFLFLSAHIVYVKFLWWIICTILSLFTTFQNIRSHHFAQQTPRKTPSIYNKTEKIIFFSAWSKQLSSWITNMKRKCFPLQGNKKLLKIQEFFISNFPWRSFFTTNLVWFKIFTQEVKQIEKVFMNNSNSTTVPPAPISFPTAKAWRTWTSLVLSGEIV